MRRIGALCVAVVLVSSCVGIDSRLKLRADGSGTLALTYRVSQLITDLGNSGGEKKIVPLPVSKQDFERSLEGVKGVALSSFRRSEDEKDITIQAELSFDSVASLSRVEAFKDAELSLVSAGAGRSFSMVVARGSTQEVNEDSLRMIDAFFDGYDLAWTIEVPSPIQKNSLGSLSTDRKALTYRMSIKDMVRLTRDQVLSLSW